MIAVEFVESSHYIQDSQKGAYVVKQSNETDTQVGDVLLTSETSDARDAFLRMFVFDPHLRFECMHGR